MFRRKRNLLKLIEEYELSLTEHRHELEEVKKNNTVLAIQIESMRGSTGGRTPAVHPQYPYRQDQFEKGYYRDLIQISVFVNKSDVLAIAKDKLKAEIFRADKRRRWYKWEPQFARKCTECFATFDKDIDEECPYCGGELREPKDMKYAILDEYFKCVNVNRQTLKDVLYQIEDDLDTYDDAFLAMEFEYVQDSEGKIISKKLYDFYRQDPIYFRPVVTMEGKPGGRWYKCLQRHTDDKGRIYEYVIDVQDPQGYYRSDQNPTKMKCEVCGRKLYRVDYIATMNPEAYAPKPFGMFVSGEIVHVQKYFPNFLHGFAPVLWFRSPFIVRQGMWDILEAYYSKQHPPRQALVLPYVNFDNFQEERDRMELKMQENPHNIMVLGMETADGKALTRPELVNFTLKPEEMQMERMFLMTARIITSFYGVSNVFMNDTSDDSGLNNEGAEIVVTNKAIERGHSIFNEKLFPQMLMALNGAKVPVRRVTEANAAEVVKWVEVKVEDWQMVLTHHVEEDLMAAQERISKKLDNAAKFFNLGFELELPPTRDLEDDDFKVSGEKVSKQAQAEWEADLAAQQAERVPETDGERRKPDQSTEEGNAQNESRHE